MDVPIHCCVLELPVCIASITLTVRVAKSAGVRCAREVRLGQANGGYWPSNQHVVYVHECVLVQCGRLCGSPDESVQEEIRTFETRFNTIIPFSPTYPSTTTGNKQCQVHRGHAARTRTLTRTRTHAHTHTHTHARTLATLHLLSHLKFVSSSWHYKKRALSGWVPVSTCFTCTSIPGIRQYLRNKPSSYDGYACMYVQSLTERTQLFTCFIF